MRIVPDNTFRCRRLGRKLLSKVDPPMEKLIVKCGIYFVFFIIIKFPYNARSDWLKQRALSENRARVDDGKLASSNFCFGILTNLTQIKHALWLRQMQWKRAICLQ